MQYRVNIIKFKHGFWSFHTPVSKYPNLPVRNLFQNSLVSGIDTMLESIRQEHGKFDVLFSDEEIECDSWKKIIMTWTRGDRFEPKNGGNWYRNEEGKEGWLCSVLFDYFSPCPLKLYIYIVKPEKRTAMITMKQRIEEILAFSKKGGFGELIPLDENDQPIR
jgi:hypothetical protein